MTVAVLFIFAALALVAIGFVCRPLLHRRNESLRARFLLAGALSTLVLGLGAGCYLILGSPYLAVRTLAGPSSQDLRGLIAVLAQRVRERPQDPRGWTLLGRGYLTLGDAADAAAAFRRAIPVAALNMRPELYSAYGEALTQSNGGEVTPDAEQAFRAALRTNPKDFAARYYLGAAYANRRDTARALALWNSLLADAPANAPWRAEVVDRMALLTSRSGATPDIRAMVRGLATRLKAQPGDLEGWQRLIRAYAILGDQAKARQSLAEARVALKSDRSGVARLSLEARQLKLEK